MTQSARTQSAKIRAGIKRAQAAGKRIGRRPIVTDDEVRRAVEMHRYMTWEAVAAGLGITRNRLLARVRELGLQPPTAPTVPDAAIRRAMRLHDEDGLTWAAAAAAIGLSRTGLLGRVERLRRAGKISGGGNGGT